ncbi:uncharacterized protein LOC125057485 [Pieris napi]|uniref:uncharacterized protein LOC125057485 n=1 Tax=Pieris napi TaxID=78633 RepID=UPI001FBA863B|nr:uncharacterized protein LOC125057485 [Pieris napi]
MLKMTSNSDSDTPVTPKKAKITKVLQKYKPEWEKQYNWLTSDLQNKSNAKCIICGVNFTISSAGIGQIKQHQNTQKHKIKTEMKKTSGALQNFLTSDTKSRCQGSSDDENIIAAELALTFHTVKHNLSYNSMDCLSKLNKIVFVDSKIASKIRLGRTKMEALVIEVLGPYSVESVINDLHDDVFFCLQTDASNKKNIKLFPLVVQYFSINEGIQNKLIDFYENSNESADGMLEAIKKSMDSHNLSFNQVSGLSADNCNANFGIHHSLYTNIKKEVPILIKGNCHAHIIHNTVKHAMGYLICDIENIVLKIYSHFSVSACRRDDLKKIVTMVDGEFHEIKRHIGTRWLSLLPAVDTLLLNWEPICNYFISLGDNCAIIIQELLKLSDHQDREVVEIYLHFTSHMLNIFNKTIKRLEGNDVTILDVYNIMDNLRNELEQRKTDKYFGYESKMRLQKIQKSSPETFNTVVSNFSLFIDMSLKYMIKWFEFSEDNWLSILSNMSLKNEVKFEHFEMVITKAKLQDRLNIKMDDMYSESIRLREIQRKVTNDDKEFLVKSTVEKWQYILKNASDRLPNIKKIISYLLSVPATSAFTERVFSIRQKCTDK